MSPKRASDVFLVFSTMADFCHGQWPILSWQKLRSGQWPADCPLLLISMTQSQNEVYAQDPRINDEVLDTSMRFIDEH